MKERSRRLADTPHLPTSAAKLAARLRKLRAARRRRHAQRRRPEVGRRTLTASERAVVLAKTARRRHICGGRVVDGWRADHVLAHSSGGAHARVPALYAGTVGGVFAINLTPDRIDGRSRRGGGRDRATRHRYHSTSWPRALRSRPCGGRSPSGRASKLHGRIWTRSSADQALPISGRSTTTVIRRTLRR